MRRALAACGAAALVVFGCTNAGEGRLLNVDAQGIVRGLVYFDMDGNRVPSAPDDSVKNVRVRLISLSGTDTIASAVTAVTGQFRITSVPVGTYKVAFDVAPLSDTAVVVAQDSLQVTVLPADSNFVIIGVSYPHVSIRAARTTVTLGHKVFIEGVVLNSPQSFRDTTMHVQDTSAAIRATRIASGTSLLPADTVRLRGTVSTRAGQRTLDLVTAFPILASAFLPAATTVTTLQASSAVNGTRDAQQLQILNAVVSDTNNPTPGQFGEYTMHLNDGTGAIEVLLDPNADPAFRRPPLGTLPGLFIPGNKFDIVGLAVPTGTGTWRLKPKSSQDMVKR